MSFFDDQEELNHHLALGGTLRPLGASPDSAGNEGVPGNCTRCGALCSACQINDWAAYKVSWHRKYLRVFRRVAKELGLARGAFEVRSTKGGPAALGELVLHTTKFYLQASNSPQAMYRTCDGLRDYKGGPNQFMPLAWFGGDLAGVLKTLRELVS